MPDDSLSLAEGALAPWAGARSEYFTGLQVGVAEFGGFSFDTPWKSLKAKDKKLVLYGTGSRSVHVTYKNRFNRKRSYEALFEGIIPWLQRRHGESESDWSREQIEQYMREVDCPECKGRPPQARVAGRHRRRAQHLRAVQPLHRQRRRRHGGRWS